MFTHIVLLTLVEGTTNSQVKEVVDALSGLPMTIPALASYTVSRDAGLADDNADIAVVATFDGVDNYFVYRDHPAHQQIIVEKIRPILAARTASQFES